ncbi:MAG: hypothetical protein L0Z62_10445 [Gemmataceae bacterium]|nr:hypothetical protein [Gemmataceae bacterium]
MSTPRRKIALLSLGTAVPLLVVLGVASPTLEGLTATNQTNPLATVKGEAVTPREDAGTPTQECMCRARSSNGCCAESEVKCCCLGERFSARPQQRGDQVALAGGDKEKMKASPEAQAKGKAARKAILDHQKALAKDGVFGCCIKPSCTFCSTSADMCPCAKMLAKGGPVCPECWGGWQAGKGRLNGVNPEKVKIIPQDKLKMMYDMRSKMFEKASAK